MRSTIERVRAIDGGEKDRDGIEEESRVRFSFTQP